MTELTVSQITEYLKQAAALETSVYQQTEVKKQATRDLVLPRFKQRVVPEPQKKYMEFNRREPEIGDIFRVESWLPPVLVGILVFYFALFAILSTEEWLRHGVYVIAIVVVLLLIKLGIGFSKYKEDKRRYDDELREYEEEKEKEEIAYQDSVKRYNAEVKTAQAVYAAQVRRAQSKYAAACAEVAKLDEPLSETQEVLNKLYAADIVFPKYRNMIAICTMYEYFASGRCTELTGANGAYNLYESELRQNFIINQLEQVNANLDQVKQNQYMLYQGIMETNQVMRNVSSDVKSMLQLTADIAKSSRVTAFCSKITAANTEAMKYIALMNSR